MKLWRLATALLLLSAEVLAQENLLLNPGFEAGPASGSCPPSWGTYGYCGQESWAARSGTNGVSFWTWNDGGWGGAWQDVAITPDPGDRLIFRIWAKAERNFISSKNEAWIQIELYTGDESAPLALARTDIYNQLIAHYDQWELYELQVTVPTDNVRKITVKFGAGGFVNVGTPQALMWDDAELIIRPGRRATVRRSNEDTIEITWTPDGERYFQIWAADSVTGPWTWLRDVTLGQAQSNLWQDNNILSAEDRLFYRIVAIPTNAPQDADRDGLDDMQELTTAGLNAADPDVDDDTIPDGSDPRPTVPNAPPVVHSLNLTSTRNFHNDGCVLFLLSVEDPDGDTVYQRWGLDAQPTSSWHRASSFSWCPLPWEAGPHEAVLEFDDGWGARSTSTVEFMIFSAPPAP